MIRLALETAAGVWYVLVWRREESVGGVRTVEIPLPESDGVEVLFAADHVHCDGTLSIRMQQLDAVLRRLRPRTRS